MERVFFIARGREKQRIKKSDCTTKHLFAARSFSGQAGYPEPRNKLFCALLRP
jgi:hypothetical protein